MCSSDLFVANTTAVSIGSNVSLTGATISGTSTDLTIRNATVQGNLVVAGSVTSVNTQSLVVNDNIIELADNNTTLDTVDSGWFSPAGNSTSVWYSGIVRQAAKSSNNNPYFWIFGSNTNPNTSTTIDTTANSVTGTLQAYLVPYGTGGAFVANSSTVLITANSTVSVNVTANNVSGNGSGVTSVNAIALGGKTESQLNVNSALTSNSTTYILANTGIISNSSGVFVDAAYINTISSNNATNLNGQPASYYTNATNITSGTLPWAQAPAGTVNTSSAFTFTAVETFNSNVVFGNATVNAITFSNTTGTYFTGTAYTANNATNLGGTAAASYQLNSTLAANVAALTANLATYIVANTGLVSNATGVYVNAAYINTISANNAAYLGGLAASSYANTSAPLITTSVTVGNATVNVTVNSTSFSGTSSNATNLNSQPGSYYTNATNITTGTLPYAQIPANIVNTTAAFTISGVHTHNANLAVNAATFTAGNTTQGTIANSAGLYFSSSDGTACSYMTTTAVYTPNLVSPTGNPLYLKTNGVTAVTILAADRKSTRLNSSH